MHKRILCGILAAILLLSLIPAIALPASAVDMKTSEACILILKSMEGFAEFPYFDYSQYSIGYGTGCNPEDYPNGITEEEADRLLREYLSVAETELNIFANNHGILFSQYQFDALMLFTYNCGTGWMNTESDMRWAVINNAQGNDFLYAYVMWCNAGGQIHPGLVGRRLQEANMYLNGVYSGRPASYTYALFEGNGGTGNSRIQGYDYNLYTPVRPTPTREGYAFLGWYTAVEGGEWIRKLTASHSQCTFYAHWQGADVNPAQGSPASYRVSPAELASNETYDIPGGTAGEAVSADTDLSVEADYVDDSGMKWGRLSSGRWVKLGNPLWGIANAPVVEEGVKVNVTGDYVNVRTGPGTTYPVVAGVVQNAVVYLTQVVAVEDVLWGKCRAGWLCLQYTDYDGDLPVEEYDETLPQIPGTPYVPEKPQQPPKNDKLVATGVVLANQLYIRAAAGSRGNPVGVYRKGDKLELLQMNTISGIPWGRTEKGWICLTYVELDNKDEKPDTEPPAPPEKNPPTPPETQSPTEPETVKQNPKGMAARVVCKGNLHVRSDAGTGSSVAGSYCAGEKIYIQEITVVDGVNWGRTDLGWVCMQYVHMDGMKSLQDREEGVVVCADDLSIRSGAGAGYAPVGSYAAGTRIQIYGQIIAAGRKWGRTDLGWVCMDCVRLDSQREEASQPTQETTIPETTVPETTAAEAQRAPTTGVITAAGLNIRRVPGDAGDVIGSYRREDQVTILEIKQINGAEWGRTDRGWIGMMYVDVQHDAEPDQGFSVTVTADALQIRKGPGTGSAVVGSYRQGDTVTVLEQAQVGVNRWGRTDLGWICMDYVK